MARKTFGELFKERRIETGRTLRAFCEEYGFDPGNISKLERGLFPPPDDDTKLAEYAAALHLRPGGEAWIEFFDLAAAEKGKLPKDLLSDAELVEKLPVLFRTLRGQKLSEARLDALVEKIRRA